MGMVKRQLTSSWWLSPVCSPAANLTASAFPQE